MARNAEKAMTTLARWRAAQLEEQRGKPERRPYLASSCHDLRKCNKWRMQVIREIAKKVAQIQNAGLGEYRIRDLNDEINKLLREKGHWEDRVKELGGPDYSKVGPKMLDHEGKEVPGNKGYKYFGAAKNLPGVRELFEQEPPEPPRKTRAEMMKEIDADYYGYRDDDDGILIPLELAEEKRAHAQAVSDWKLKKKEEELSGQAEKKNDQPEEDIYDPGPDPLSDEEVEVSDSEMDEAGQPRFIAHVPVPSQKEIEEALILRKKEELMKAYTSESLQEQTEEAKKLLGI